MDTMVESIFRQEMSGDTSFLGESSGGIFSRTPSYSSMDMRETWHKGIKYGIDIGLRRASLEGQRIELNHNTPEGKNKEFLEKFYKLADEYRCAIQYHPERGMCVVDISYRYNQAQ